MTNYLTVTPSLKLFRLRNTDGSCSGLTDATNRRSPLTWRGTSDALWVDAPSGTRNTHVLRPTEANNRTETDPDARDYDQLMLKRESVVTESWSRCSQAGRPLGAQLGIGTADVRQPSVYGAGQRWSGDGDSSTDAGSQRRYSRSRKSSANFRHRLRVRIRANMTDSSAYNRGTSAFVPMTVGGSDLYQIPTSSCRVRASVARTYCSSAQAAAMR
jgi:hypothetical protein